VEEVGEAVVSTLDLETMIPPDKVVDHELAVLTQFRMVGLEEKQG
jgi:hypothetical protein